ncbi:MAG: hypothetical protein ABMA26_19375 [Limisphaerales bacterium]
MPDLIPTTELKTRLRQTAATLAAEGIYIGTSSWKHAGWTGLLYDEQRHHYRGKFAEARFPKLELTVVIFSSNFSKFEDVENWRTRPCAVKQSW